MSYWPHTSFLSRGKAIQMHLGRLHMEVCPLWWADEALQKTHGGEALQVRRLWPQLLQIWPLGPAPTETHASVNHTERNNKRSMEQAHTRTHRQPGERDLPVNVFQLAWTHTQTCTQTHKHKHIDARTHSYPSLGGKMKRCTKLVEHKTGSLLDPHWGWKE